MSFIQYYLNEIMTFLSHEKKVYTLLRSSPEGGLICDRHRENKRFLHCFPQGKDAAGHRMYRRRTITDDQEIFAALATKEYARVALKIIDHNLDILTKAMNALLPMDPGSIRGRMRRTYQTLPDLCFEPIRRANPSAVQTCPSGKGYRGVAA